MRLPEHERSRAFTTISALRDDHGAGAASELVAYLESEDEAVSL